MKIVSRLKFYKNLFKTFVGLNLLSVALLLFLFGIFFRHSQKDQREISQFFSQIQKMELLEHSIQDLNKSLKLREKTNPVQEFQMWSQAQTVFQKEDGPLSDDFFLEKDIRKKQSVLNQAIQSVNQKRRHLIKHFEAFLKKTQSFYKILVYGCFLVLLLGVLLPWAGAFWAYRKIKSLKEEIEGMLLSFFKKILREKDKYDRAFQNPEFWIQVVALTLELGGAYSRNPFLIYVSGLSRLLSEELNKQKAGPASTAA